MRYQALSATLVFFSLMLLQPVMGKQPASTLPIYPAADAVRINPFARPVLITAAPERQPVLSQQQATPRLRGVLAAGAASFANVDGNIIALGESFGDLTLVNVEGSSATFSRGSSRITLTVSSDPAPAESPGNIRVEGVSL